MVDRLRIVRMLMDHGHCPGEILALTAREFTGLLRLSEPRPTAPAARSEAEVQARELDELLGTLADLDRVSLMEALRRNWARMGPISFLDDLAGVFMAEVGARWRSGKLKLLQEHFAAGCLSDFLREVREPFQRQATGPKVIASTLSGDRHEAGLLALAVVLALRGYRVTYLGADTPIDQIADAVSGDIAAVAVSISSAVPRSRAAKGVSLLRDALPKRVSLWIGGAGAPPPPMGVERFESLSALDSHL